MSINNNLDRNQRKQEIRRRKRRRENFIIITAVFLALTIFLGSKYVLSVLNDNKTTNVAKKDNSKTTDKNISSEKNTVVENGKDNKDNNGLDLADAGNYVKSADNYAYDTATIRDYILSKKEYNGKKVAFLTFDDGVTPGITDKVLDILKEKKVPATFFIVGKTLSDSAKPYLERELKEGHSIAIHSFSHSYEKLYPNRVPNPTVIKDEAQKTLDRLKELLGDKFKTAVWRYPGGHMSWKGLDSENNADQALKSLGLEWIDWNSLNGDAEPLKKRPTDEAKMVEFVKTSLTYWKQQNIAVVLMHDSAGKELTIKALPNIIEHFKSEGYEFGILK